ncbi:hypothetical protein HFN60_17085 [Rhizobium leguminosarum]|uniref:transposase n=1 Tax=Rhizobium leguminosarum TaxID=384 RepID=UPI001441C36C|nr:transposase [Rhizobium leguminosarum]MBY5817341.1 hypothetical protein [Rhizobium leguminosarum]NKL02553.1 hypothetical protein [Rhizobium leguminosarum bv. viciae]
MDEFESLSHSKWECKYHVVFIPKYRRKVLYGEKKKGFTGQHFWARGYFVSTVGRDEETIREYIRNQEKEDHRLEQLNLWR